LKYIPLYIVRRALVVLLPMLLTLISARAQTTVYQGVTSQLNVELLPGDTYAWEIYTDIPVDFAVVPGNCPLTSANIAGANTGANVSVNWIKPGIYFYKVTARDAAFCAMNFKVGMFTVLPAQAKAVITGMAITGACQQVQLDATKSLGIQLQYEWSNADPEIALTNTTGANTEFSLSPSYKGTLPANFEVNLKVTDIRGKTDNTTISIKVDRLPVANVYSTGKYEPDGTMLVDAKLSSGTALNYIWYTTPGGDITGPDNQQIANLYGAGTYTLKVTDLYRCMNEYSFPLKFDQIIAVRDYARMSWAQDTILHVLANDNLPEGFIPGPVRITSSPAMGDVVTNIDGTVSYTPRNKVPVHDQFDYEVCDAVGNCSSATVTIDIFDSPIFVPEGLSPNGDGINDVMKFQGLDKYPKSQLYVFTRNGRLIFGSDDYQNDWGGTNSYGKTSNFELVPTGTYYYTLKLGGTNRTLKQFIYIGY
jgi:gliding motility-associated-like protein